MKICINSKYVEGPYGGGAPLVRDLRDKFASQGHLVVNTLNDNDIDVILNINYLPFTGIKIAQFSFFDAYNYVFKHPKTKIVTQVNECDERKNTSYINELILTAAKYSHSIVFISSWLKELFETKKINPVIPHDVILNGANEQIFNLINKKSWDGKSKLKVVTHHWSPNYLKGHDIYQHLDKLLAIKKFRGIFEFTYIGQIPKSTSYRNTRILKPLSGKELAKELKKHHIYLTASRNEPAGMHHIEGALCGLPLLYINSGALPEYCRNYGIEFSSKNFEKKLLEIKDNYYKYFKKMDVYSHNATEMADGYLKLFRKLQKNNKSVSTVSSIGRFLDQLYYQELWKIRKHLHLIKT